MSQADITRQRFSRRTLFRLGGCAGIAVAAGGVGGVILDRQTDFFDRLQGISHTPELTNPDAWAYADHTLTLALDQISELAEPGSAVQLDDDALPRSLLIVHGKDGGYYVFVNECTHGKRKIDLSDGKLKCTSLSASTFDYSGAVLSGPAEDDLTTYTVTQEDDDLIITLAVSMA